MGVNLAPLLVKRMVNLESLRGKYLAVDANNELHQFLSLIRLPDGTPLMDREGHVTSHLIGLSMRTSHLMHTYGVKQVFIFDGEPPPLKRVEIMKRREQREKLLLQMMEAQKRGDYAKAFSKAVRTGRLTPTMIEDAKKALSLLGIPYVLAPSEAEAQAAYMASRSDVWAASSRDYDSILFGAPRLIRYVTISGKEWLPSKGRSRPLKPELIELEQLLATHGITREQLVDVAILIGTDFNTGVRGIGPKKALNLVKQHGDLERLPKGVRSETPENYEDVRRIFLQPKVNDHYNLNFGTLNEEGLHHFLCDERSFSEMKVRTVVQRMREFYANLRDTGLKRWA